MTRRTDEAVEGVKKIGGIPYVEDWVRMSFLPYENILENIKKALAEGPNLFYFTTGEGLRAIFETSQKDGLLEELTSYFKKGLVFVRGYKARAVMLKYGFKDFKNVESTEVFIKALEKTHLKNSSVFVQMYGEEPPELEGFLKERGAKMLKVWVYKYEVDKERLDAFISKLLERFFSAVLFTSAYQVEYLFKRAKEKGLNRELSKCLNREVITVAVGHKTAKRLFEEGVLRVYYPERERLVLAIKELERAFRDG